MNETYRSAHPEQFMSSYVSDNMGDHLDDVFLTSVSADALNSAKAVSKVRDEYGVDIETSDRSSYVEALEALYRGEGDVMIMSASFESMIADNEEYENFRNDVKIIYSAEKEVKNTIPASSAELTKKPFIVFFGGNDEEGELYLEGKTDVSYIDAAGAHRLGVAALDDPGGLANRMKS